MSLSDKLDYLYPPKIRTCCNGYLMIDDGWGWRKTLMDAIWKHKLIKGFDRRAVISITRENCGKYTRMTIIQGDKTSTINVTMCG